MRNFKVARVAVHVEGDLGVYESNEKCIEFDSKKIRIGDCINFILTYDGFKTRWTNEKKILSSAEDISKKVLSKSFEQILNDDTKGKNLPFYIVKKILENSMNKYIHDFLERKITKADLIKRIDAAVNVSDVLKLNEKYRPYNPLGKDGERVDTSEDWLIHYRKQLYKFISEYFWGGRKGLIKTYQPSIDLFGKKISGAFIGKNKEYALDFACNYNLIFTEKDFEIKEYTILENIADLMCFEILELHKRKFSVRKCQQCGKIFLSFNKHNSLYCTIKCKKKAYASRVEKDEKRDLIRKLNNRITRRFERYAESLECDERYDENNPTIWNGLADELIQFREELGEVKKKMCDNTTITYNELNSWADEIDAKYTNDFLKTLVK